MRLPRAARTASFRLAALYAILFVASVLVLGGVVYLSARSAIEKQMTARIDGEFVALEEEYLSGGVDELRSAVLARQRAPASIDYLVLLSNGERLAGNLPPLERRPGWVELTIKGRPESKTHSERLRVRVGELGSGVWLAVGDDMARIEEMKQSVLTALAWAVALVVALGIAGGMLLSMGFLRRVDAIARTAEGIIDGDLSRRVPLRGTGDDLDHLAGTLNRMLDRIAALMESLRQVSNDIAHDMRTPLTRLRQRLEAARSPGVVAETVEDAIADTDSILETFSAILRIAQIESGSRRAQFRAVDLGELVRTVTETFAPVAEDSGHRLSVAVEDGIALQGDGELLTQMLVNLIENALRHTPSGSHIRVSLARAADGIVRLAVADDGPGVPARERARIFRRFYRCEASRTTPGSGLGLSLVAAVCDLHGARVSAEDGAPGLVIAVEFAAA